MTPEPLPAQGFSSSPDEASGAGADVADLLREAARGVELVARDPAADPAVKADLRRRLLAAAGAARHDRDLARRRLAALMADLEAQGQPGPAG